jgi:hypothetical protein
MEGLFADSEPSQEQVRKLESEFGSLEKRAADPELTISAAFEIAIAMEGSEVNDIYCLLTTPLHRSMYLLRRKTMASMPDHLERLLQEARNYGVQEGALKNLERAATQDRLH